MKRAWSLALCAVLLGCHVVLPFQAIRDEKDGGGAAADSWDSGPLDGAESEAPRGAKSIDARNGIGDSGAGSYWATCQELRSASPTTADGEVTLYLDHDPARPWQAYCADMSGTPTEYLVLVRTGAAVNFAQYTAGGASPGTDVRTVYTRLRFDPSTMQVDTSDQTFTSSSGSLQHTGGQAVTAMPYGVAMSCAKDGANGLANVDLRGTPFRATRVFKYRGVSGEGEPTYTYDDQRVDSWVRGYCASVSPNSTYNPFNQNGGELQLAHIGQ